jgi:hypothetical protein
MVWIGAALLILALASIGLESLAAAQRTFQARRLSQWYFPKSTRLEAIWIEFSSTTHRT